MQPKILSSALLPWYAKHQRDLPWRKTHDPYLIWVSEIMLQQTQVKTVVPYYERWIQAFPDIASLAKAPLPKVLKLWEGLGYYRRARNLHETAQLLIEKHGGQFPSDPETIYSLPGIGKYTGGAILSIAFGKSAPILDGNVARILSRLFAIKDPVDRGKGQKKLWGLAALLLPDKHPGDFNQAMMELGATVCLPAAPACLICPVSGFCKARQAGKEEDFPLKSGKMTIKKVRAACAIIRNNGKILITQRPENGLWAELWEFPTFRLAGKEETKSFLKTSLAETGLEAEIRSLKTSLKRSYTNHAETLEVYDCELIREKRNPGTGAEQGTRKWVTRRDLKKFTFPSAHAKIIAEHL